MYKKIKSEFKEYLRFTDKSPETIYNRMLFIEHFFGFLRKMEVIDPVDIISPLLKEYRRYLYGYINKTGHKDKPRTTNSRIQAVRLFLRFLYVEDYVVQDFTSELPYVKEPRSLPRVTLTDKEIKQILKACDTGSVMGYRDRTILEVFYSSGLRRNELINLKVEDVDTEGGYIRVNEGKGNKDRVTPLGKIGCRYVNNYVTGIRRLLLSNREDNQWLFLSKSGNKLDKTAIRNIVINSAERAGIKKGVTSHVYRRSCATEMIKNNANIMHVKDILGHEDISTTQLYARLTITDLKKAHKKYHPRERGCLGI